MSSCCTISGRISNFFVSNLLIIMSKSSKEWEEWLYHKQRVELLKDVFTLIYPKLITRGNPKNVEDKEAENEARNDRLQKWLQDITQAVSQEESPWGEPERLDSSMNLLPQFLLLMRECMLTHQWAHILTMLDCVSHIPYGADWAIWKANLATLYTEPGDNVNLVQDFFRHSYLLQECNVRDVVLEFVHYLISQGMTQEASQAIQTSRKSKKGVVGGPQHDFTKHLIDMLDAYQGLIFYVDWKAELYKKSASSQSSSLSESFYNLTSSQGLSSDAIKIIAKRALLGLDGLPHKPGVWDIFLTKSVEIHQFYEEFEKARELLRVYRDKNPDNPNSHRFLYEFLQRNCCHFDDTAAEAESISCLEGVAKLDPANPLVLTLCQKLADQGDITRGLQYIFDLLDNAVWQDREDGWLCLVQSLTACMTMNKTDEKKLALQKEVKRCWASRQDWWPAYHFNPKLITASHGPSVSCPTSSGLLLAKSILASVLIGPDCSFCQSARKAMDESSLTNLDMALSKLNPLSKHLKRSKTSSGADVTLKRGTVIHATMLDPDEEDCELPVNFVRTARIVQKPSPSVHG